MPQVNSPAAGAATWIIETPVIAVVLFATALAVATMLVRVVPRVRNTLLDVEANRQTSIDGLRGLLGIGVFIHHTVITWFLLHDRAWGLPPSRVIVHLGQTSVALFFMITAFLFWGRVLDKGSRLDWKEFFVSRLFRLYPVYLLMIALLVAGVMATTLWSQPSITGPIAWPLAHWLILTLFYAPDMNGLPSTMLLVAGVTWSLRYELLFYLALPLMGAAAGRTRKPVAGLLSAIILALILRQLGGSNALNPNILLSFTGGIIAAYLVRSPRFAAIGKSPIAGLTAVAALVLVVTLLPTAFTWPATLGLTLFFTVVASGHHLWGLLRLPGLLWLGDITYSIYLLHGFLLWLVLQQFWPRTLASDGPVFLGSAIAIDIVVVLLGSIVFLTIERPGVLLGKRCLRISSPYPAVMGQDPAPSGRKASSALMVRTRR